MRVAIKCHRCSRPGLFEIEDEGIYVVECEEGHRTRHMVSNLKFDILFEMAILAFGDGYTREAVATLAASLEEFYRLFVRMVLVKHKLYEGDLFGEARKFWKLVYLAERELGAFGLAYFLEKKAAPPFPDKPWTDFRNSVIHRGRIPKSMEVLKNAQRIVDFMVPLYQEYRMTEAMMLAGIVDRIDTIVQKHGEQPESPSSSTHHATAFQWLLGQENPSFESALEYALNYSFLRHPAAG